MDWQIILAIILLIPLILFPAAFIWYMNVGGLYIAARERQFKVFAPFVRRVRIGLAVIVPIGIYASLIWFSWGNLGWQVAVALAFVLPIVLSLPVLIWVAVVSGLYQVARDTLRRRALAPRRRVGRVTEEAVREVA